MRARFLKFAVAALTATLLAAPALAAEPEVAPKGEWVEPPKELPHLGLRDSVNNLDFLFGALKAAPDEETAKAAGSTGTPSSLAYIMRMRSSGRGRLPVWVVRKRSVLRCMAFRDQESGGQDRTGFSDS